MNCSLLVFCIDEILDKLLTVDTVSVICLFMRNVNSQEIRSNNYEIGLVAVS